MHFPHCGPCPPRQRRPAAGKLLRRVVVRSRPSRARPRPSRLYFSRRARRRRIELGTAHAGALHHVVDRGSRYATFAYQCAAGRSGGRGVDPASGPCDRQPVGYRQQDLDGAFHRCRATSWVRLWRVDRWRAVLFAFRLPRRLRRRPGCTCEPDVSGWPQACRWGRCSGAGAEASGRVGCGDRRGLFHRRVDPRRLTLRA